MPESTCVVVQVGLGLKGSVEVTTWPSRALRRTQNVVEGQVMWSEMSLSWMMAVRCQARGPPVGHVEVQTPVPIHHPPSLPPTMAHRCAEGQETEPKPEV